MVTELEEDLINSLKKSTNEQILPYKSNSKRQQMINPNGYNLKVWFSKADDGVINLFWLMLTI